MRKRVKKTCLPHNTTPELSVIIPTLNEELYISKTLDSLRQRSTSRLDVLIVDSSSNDHTKSAVSRKNIDLQIRYIHTSRQDIGYQRNLGARMARYDRLLFLDADTLVGEGALDACVRLDGGQLYVASIKHVPDRSSFTIKISMKVIYALIYFARAFGMPVTNGDFILTNKRTYHAVGGFREGYLLGEDTDFGVRAKRVGAKAPMIWKFHVVASSRRLAVMSPFALIGIWSKAYLRAISSGPTPKSAERSYPFGEWGSR